MRAFNRWLLDPHRPPLVMGILNLTPDSFSDGGQFCDIDHAVDHVGQLIAEGADWIDIGGESTRPGAVRVSAEEQIRRIVPVLRALRTRRANTLISVDTSLATVAEAALGDGANVINDVSAGRDDPAMFPLLARSGAAAILMHMQGQPATMQVAPRYDDVVAEICTFLSERVDAAEFAGIDRARLLVDPGIGFGKTVDHNLELLRRLREFRRLERPLVLGTSRKGFIAKVTGDSDPHRLFGTAATIAWSIANGADVVRVHDLAAMSQVVRMVRAIQNQGPSSGGLPPFADT